MSTASTSSPTRRSTSVSVRTVVVLPVPPLSESTAMVTAMAVNLPSGPAGAALWQGVGRDLHRRGDPLRVHAVPPNGALRPQAPRRLARALAQLRRRQAARGPAGRAAAG